jgi:hypothetical protein
MDTPQQTPTPAPSAPQPPPDPQPPDPRPPTPQTPIEPPPVRVLTVLYDPTDRFAPALRDWLLRERPLVPLDVTPVTGEEARRRFTLPAGTVLGPGIAVVADSGAVWLGDAAWVMCLWALRRHRRTAHRLARSGDGALARATVLAAAGWQDRTLPSPARWQYSPATGWSALPPPPGRHR